MKVGKPQTEVDEDSREAEKLGDRGQERTTMVECHLEYERYLTVGKYSTRPKGVVVQSKSDDGGQAEIDNVQDPIRMKRECLI